MPIDVTCPTCGRTLRAADRQAGKRCKCPGCATLLTVPMPVGGKRDGAGSGEWGEGRDTAGGSAAREASPDVTDDLAALARAAAQARGETGYEDRGSRIEEGADAPSSVLRSPSSLPPP